MVTDATRRPEQKCRPARHRRYRPGMASWRDSTSSQAQEDLDGLLNEVLSFAETRLSKYGEMYPFGAAVETGGKGRLLAADPGQGEHPSSLEVLETLYAGAREHRAELRAVAFAADVTANGSDAPRVETEHQEGVALTVLLPYARSRFKKSLTLGQMSVSAGERRIWAEV